MQGTTEDIIASYQTKLQAERGMRVIAKNFSLYQDLHRSPEGDYFFENNGALYRLCVVTARRVQPNGRERLQCSLVIQGEECGSNSVGRDQVTS